MPQYYFHSLWLRCHIFALLCSEPVSRGERKGGAARQLRQIPFINIHTVRHGIMWASEASESWVLAEHAPTTPPPQPDTAAEPAGFIAITITDASCMYHTHAYTQTHAHTHWKCTLTLRPDVRWCEFFVLMIYFMKIASFIVEHGDKRFHMTARIYWGYCQDKILSYPNNIIKNVKKKSTQSKILSKSFFWWK